MTIRSIKILGAVTGAFVMLLAAASIARADDKLIAHVPFDFIVGNLRMPAGNYVVTEDVEHSLLSIASTDRKHFTFVLANAVAPEDSGTKPELVFDRYGGNNFLARVVDYNGGREIPLTPATMKREMDRVAMVTHETVAVPLTSPAQ